MLIFACSPGRYPCPKAVKPSNSEKDGTGITLIEVQTNSKGLLKKKQPKKIRKK
jgi:hypothetical protein